MWIIYGTNYLPFANSKDKDAQLVRRAMIVIPVVLAWIFIHGYRHGKDDLSSFADPYEIELKNGTKLQRVMLRTLDKGVLIREPLERRLEFRRWDEIAKLSRRDSFITTPLSCRWFEINCPTAEP